MNSTIERICELTNKCPDDADRNIAQSLLEGARLNATVADEPEVYKAYTSVIKEYLLASDVLEFTYLVDVYWLETESERERVLGNYN